MLKKQNKFTGTVSAVKTCALKRVLYFLREPSDIPLICVTPVSVSDFTPMLLPLKSDNISVCSHFRNITTYLPCYVVMFMFLHVCRYLASDELNLIMSSLS